MRLITRLAFAVIALVISGSVQAKEVSLDRILAEHRITVVTMEKPESIDGYLLDMGIVNPSKTTLTELMISARSLQDENSLLFLIDRRKTKRMIAQEESLLPCRLSAIAADEVVLFAAKARGRNAWEIMISAPNGKWLQWELDRLTKSHLSDLQLQAKGTVLERFKVKRLCVVSTEPKQVAADWIAAQSRPGQDAIDWDYYSADSFDGATDSGTDMMFILSSQSLAESAKKNLLPYLPKAAQEWFADGAQAQEHAACRQVKTDDDGTSRCVSAIAAPSARHLGIALDRYSKLTSIPESIERTKLADLREYGRMIVVARFADRDRYADPKVLDDLAGNLTNSISAQTGFECVNRQDLKELALETYLNQLPDKEKSSDIRDKFGNATAVAVVDLSSITTETNYTAGNPKCLTPVLPAFGEAKPQQPHEPDPDDQPLFSAHKYDKINGSRANDPKFKKDHNDWQYNKMPAYRDALGRWERNKREYEYRRLVHDMEWVTSITRSQHAKVTGNLRIYNLASGEVEQAGEIVFSCPLAGDDQHSDICRDDRVVVRGEDNRPQASIVPNSTASVTDETVITDALRAACTGAVQELMATALLPIDGAPIGQRSASER